MSMTFDPDEVSDREALPRTPTLADSTSSLNDSLLQSPYSTKFLSTSPTSPTKRSSYPDSQGVLDGNCRAWWGDRTSTDSSNWRASLHLRSREQVFDIPSCERLERFNNNPCRSDETASITPAPTPSRRSVSGAKGTPPPDVNTEEPDVECDAESESSSYSRFQRATGTSLAELSQPSSSSLPILALSSVDQLQLEDATSTETAPSNRSIPHLSIVHQSTELEPLYGPPVGLSPQLNISHANSSMLAHCDQSSLAPPCVRMTQTQCGRSALREAGIAHGSPRALAPSIPIENIPNRAHSGNFFRRLVRKTLSISSFSISTTSSSRQPLVPSGAPVRKHKYQHSWPTRHTTKLSEQAGTSSGSQAPSAPKKSRWELIQRFVAKPSTAAKAVGTNVPRRARTQPRHGGVDHTRRHTVMSGHSSSVSFFGDPLMRIDPFARSDGLGATVSPTDGDSPEPYWNVTLGAGDQDAHIAGFSTEEIWRQSRGVVTSTGACDTSSTDPKRELLSCRSSSRCISRRYSTPVLGESSWSFAKNP